MPVRELYKGVQIDYICFQNFSKSYNNLIRRFEFWSRKKIQMRKFKKNPSERILLHRDVQKNLPTHNAALYHLLDNSNTSRSQQCSARCKFW